MLNFQPEMGLLGTLKHYGYFPNWKLHANTGKSISLLLGWTGFVILCISNVYTIKKRVFPNAPGRLMGWLNFHIFCGLLGPTFILFHTNFKVGGLVAVSFWCMVISFASGIVGRYFYLQVTSHKRELEKYVGQLEETFFRNANLDSSKVNEIKGKAMALAGIPPHPSEIGPFSAVYRAVKGDIQMNFAFGLISKALNEHADSDLRKLILATRKLVFLEQFRKMIGYWHSFHMPFAIFMYVVAVIHIITATVLAVGELS